MGPANEEIRKFAGADNVAQFMKYVDEARK
jgi:hypothetical protein